MPNPIPPNVTPATPLGLRPPSALLQSLQPAVSTPQPLLSAVSDQLSALPALGRTAGSVNLFEIPNRVETEGPVKPETLAAVKTVPGHHWLGTMASNSNHITNGLRYNIININLHIRCNLW